MEIAQLKVRPIAGAIGAEVLGVDISRPLDESVILEIRSALLDHNVIFFRGQVLQPLQLKAFARQFGEHYIHPNLIASQYDPAIQELRREAGDRRVAGEDWHTDGSVFPAPPMATILYGVEVPPFGGDTLFSNQYLAYETLSEGMKHLLRDLKALFTDRHVAGPNAGINAQRSTKVREDADWRPTVTAHPLVRYHPETGRPALYLSPQTAFAIEGMTEAESRPLLDYLAMHCRCPEFSCRFRWEPGSVAFWDNRCSLHRAIADTGSMRRVMWRTQISGNRTGTPASSIN